MKHKSTSTASLLFAAAAMFTGSLQAAPPLIYGSFADPDASLNGNTPGPGLTGTWDSSASVVPGSLLYGALQSSNDNKVSTSNTYGGVSVDGTTLSAAGLLNDGAELWFSVLIQAGADIGTNGDLGFVLGTDRISSGNNIPITNSGQAMGVRFKNNLMRAAYWSPSLLQSGGGAAPANTLFLVVGRFIWGAAADTVEIYNVGRDLVLGSPVSTYTTLVNVDQSLFDTVSFASKASSPPHFIDEIRFGASAADVLPADTSTLTLASSDFVDNKAGGPVLESETLVYTVTFSKLVDPATVDASDFGNAGSAPITINGVTVTDNKAFVTVTPTFPGATGTLQLQVKAGAVIKDYLGAALDTTSAIADDTVITVNADTVPPTVVSIVSPAAATPIYGLPPILYTVTFDKYFMDDATVTASDFVNAGTASISVGAVTKTSTGTQPATYTFSVTPTSTGTLQLRLAGTVSDQIGNSVVTPVDDDITYTFASPEPAKKTITLDSVLDSSLRYVGGSTKTFTFNASGSDKVVVIGTGEHNFGGNLSGKIKTVTYDGVPLIKAVEQLPPYSALQTTSSLWYLDNPAAATASMDVGDPDPLTPGTIQMTVEGNGTNYVQTAFALSGTAPGFGGASAMAIATPTVDLLVSSPNSFVVSWLTLGGVGNTAATAESVLASSPAGAVMFGSKRQPNNYAGHALAYSTGLTVGMNTFSFNTGLTDVLTLAAEFLAADATTGGTTYATWQATNGAVGQAINLDHDNDGVSNGVEYFLGGGTNTTGFTALPGVTNTAGTLSVTFTKAASYPGVYGTDYVVQTSSTLEPGSWTNETVGGNVTITGNQVTYTFPSGTKNFARLKVTGP